MQKFLTLLFTIILSGALVFMLYRKDKLVIGPLGIVLANAQILHDVSWSTEANVVRFFYTARDIHNVPTECTIGYIARVSKQDIAAHDIDTTALSVSPWAHQLNNDSYLFFDNPNNVCDVDHPGVQEAKTNALHDIFKSAQTLY